MASRDLLWHLLQDVERLRATRSALCVGAGALDLDIVCSIVEAHLEAGDEEALMGLRADALSITGKARLRLAIAALHYLVDGNDVIPDALPGGFNDDLVVISWASRMARAELPV